MRKKIELLVLLLALAGIYTVSRNLEKYVQSDQVKSEQERKMDLVVIDSGHGGSDPGKVGINEVLEKDINLKISKQVEKELKNKGYQVVMTREKDQMLAGETSGTSKIQDMKARVDLMNIRPSAAIRQNYNEIADLCRKSSEPVFLTKNGEGDLVVMDIESFNRREKMLKLREELLAVEEDRLAGRTGCSLDELESYLDNIIEEG